MKSLLIVMFVAVSAAAAQEVVNTRHGVYTVYLDDQGRYARQENDNGIITYYLYDSPAAADATGLTIRIDDKVSLTVHFDDKDGNYSTPGLPKLKMIRDADYRTTEVRADNTAIARFEYARDRSIAGITLPGHLALHLTPSDAHHQVHQSLVDAKGAVLSEATVTSSVVEVGIWNRISFEGVRSALGLDADALDFDQTADNRLMIGRDAKGRVLLYIVTVGNLSVGFTPDGAPRFYELMADVFDRNVEAHNETGIPVALDQKLAAPSYITLTADGRPGFYVEEPGNGAIYAAWVEKRPNGRGTVPAFARATAEKLTPATSP
jgi:hypothetical protein